MAYEQKQNGSLITEQDQLGHCSPTATQTLQAGFPHEEMGIIQTWSNWRKKSDKQQEGDIGKAAVYQEHKALSRSLFNKLSTS